jgi:hypothetical protein
MEERIAVMETKTRRSSVHIQRDLVDCFQWGQEFGVYDQSSLNVLRCFISI